METNLLSAEQTAALVDVIVAGQGGTDEAIARAGEWWPELDWDELVEMSVAARGNDEDGTFTPSTLVTHLIRTAYVDGDEDFADVPVRPASEVPDDLELIGEVAHRLGLRDVSARRVPDGRFGIHWTIWATTPDGSRLAVSTSSGVGGLGVAELRADDEGVEPIWEVADMEWRPDDAFEAGVVLANHFRHGDPSTARWNPSSRPPTVERET